MSELFDEMENKDNNSNRYKSEIIYQNSLDFSNIPIIPKNEFANHYHVLCKHCKEIPILEFITNNKIRFICGCKNSPRDLNVNEIYNFLYYFEEEDLGIKKLKCNAHFKQYVYYCEECKKNLCPQCFGYFKDCKHKNKIISLILKNNIIDKYNYIYKRIEEEIQKFIDDENKSFDYINSMKKRINLQNNKIKCNIRDDNLIGDSNDSIIENKDTNLINNDEKKILLIFWKIIMIITMKYMVMNILYIFEV